MRNVLFQVHWLVGLVIGAILAFSGLTGALMAFGPEITNYFQGGYAHIEPAGRTALPVPEMYARVHAALPERQVTELTTYADPSQPTRVRFAVQKDWIGPTAPIAETRMVDPYSGALLENRPFGRSVERFIWWLHEVHQGHWGGPGAPAGNFGAQAVGYGAVTLFFMALSGLYLRWPRGKAAGTFKAWFYLNPRLKGRAFLFGLHAVLGTCALAFYLVLAHSGAFQSGKVLWYANGVRALVGQPPLGRPTAAPGGPPSGPGFKAGGPGGWGAGRGKVIVYQMHAAGYFDEDADAIGATQSTFDPATGELAVQPEKAVAGFGAELVAYNQIIHEGRILGRFGTLLVMLAGFAMPAFYVTGWIMYLKRRRARRAA